MNQELEKRTRVEARERELEANKNKLGARKQADRSELAPFFPADVEDSELADR